MPIEEPKYYKPLPPRRPVLLYGIDSPSKALGVGVALVAVIAFGLPWVVRALNWLGPLYEAYAKWACQC